MQDAREMSVLPSGERVSLGGSLEWGFGQSRVNKEADGPCKCIYAIIGTDFCCIRVLIR